MSSINERIRDLKHDRSELARQVNALDRAIEALEGSKTKRITANRPRPMGGRIDEDFFDKVLAYVRENPGFTVKDIHDGLGTNWSRSSVHHAMKRLEISNLVRQEGYPKQWYPTK